MYNIASQENNKPKMLWAAARKNFPSEKSNSPVSTDISENEFNVFFSNIGHEVS